MSIYKKLLEVQKELGAIKKDSTNPYFKSKYFDINSLLEHVKPVLNKHGLLITQALSNIDGKLALTTSIMSEDRFSAEGIIDGSGSEFAANIISSTCPLPEVSDPQKAGSAITYFRRYALQSLLALEAGEDDDANHASGKTTKTNEGNDLPF